MFFWLRLSSPASGCFDLLPFFFLLKICQMEQKLQAQTGAGRFVLSLTVVQIHQAKGQAQASHFANALKFIYTQKAW